MLPFLRRSNLLIPHTLSFTIFDNSTLWQCNGVSLEQGFPERSFRRRWLSASILLREKQDELFGADALAVQYNAHTKKPVKIYYNNDEMLWKSKVVEPTKDEAEDELASSMVASGSLPFGSYPRTNWRYWLHFVLPEHYPLSVGPGYPHYQAWLFIQWVLQSFTYVFSTYALLSSVGVSNALSLSAAMNWVLKDGLGCIGMMMSASVLGGLVDVNPKRTKWFSDCVFHSGVAIELALLVLPRGDPFTWIVLASIANALKATAGLIGGACRASINQAFALRQNLGDITAKAQAQSTLGYLVGMLGSLPLSQFIGESVPRVFAAVAVFSAAALFSSHRALSSVPIRTLNIDRAAIFFRQYLAGSQDLSPEAVRKREAILRPQKPFVGSLKHAKLVFGSEIERAFVSPVELQSTARMYAHHRYLLHVRDDHSRREVHVLLHHEATVEDQLKALWHCFTLDRCTEKDEAEVLDLVDEEFPAVYQRIQAEAWNTERVFFTTSEARLSWSRSG